MTNREALEVIERLGVDSRGYPKLKEAIDMAIEALQRGLENVNADSCSEEPNRSDLISRQDAIDALEKMSANYTGVGEREWHPHVRECQYEIQCLPSAQPERKKGEWVETEFLKLMECSCCHVRWGMYDVENFKFCPNCGSHNGGKNEI